MKDVLHLWAELDKNLPLEQKCQKNKEDQEKIRQNIDKWDYLISRLPAHAEEFRTRKKNMIKWLALLERYPSRTYTELQFEFLDDIEGPDS